MSNAVGYSILLFFIAMFVSAFLSKLYIKKHHKEMEWLDNFLSWLMILLPSIFMTIIRLDWKFGTKFLPTQQSEKITWSIFHIASLVIMVAYAIFILKRANADTVSERRYLFGRLNKVENTIFQLGILLISIEVFKQLVYLQLEDGIKNYLWYGFPLQFCSTPLFVYPLAPLFKNKKIKDALFSFIGIFTLIGGLAVMIVGTSVFTLEVAISVHTMIWHGTMVVVGLYTIATQKIGTKWTQYRDALIVLVIFILIAQGFNVLFHNLSADHPQMAFFDGFFINPWVSNVNMPVLSNIRISLQNSGLHIALVGIFFSLIYLASFALGGLLVFLLCKLFFIKHKTKSQNLETAKV